MNGFEKGGKKRWGVSFSDVFEHPNDKNQKTVFCLENLHFKQERY